MTLHGFQRQQASPVATDMPKPNHRRALMAGALATAMLVGSASAAFARPAPDGFSDLVKKVTPAVVAISVTKDAEGPAMMQGPEGPGMPFGQNEQFQEFFKRYFGDEAPGSREFRQMPSPGGREMKGVGSGFIVDEDGYVVTNNHVVDGADEIVITLKDGEDYEATLIGRDDRTDLALLKVESDDDLPFVTFGDSDEIEIGDWVMAVGNPFGLGGTVTAGIISARGRDLPGGTLIDFLQIDAPINQGNSGGPAFNLDGEVIGVNTAIYSPNGGSVGIGFAIPSDMAEQVIAELREHGKIERGWLGVRIQAVTDDIAEGFGLEDDEGALIASVEPDSPAEKAGLKAGDVILSWDGKSVEELKDLPRLVASTPVDNKTEVTVWREGKEKKLHVITGTMPESRKQASLEQAPARKSDGEVLPGTGITVVDLTPQARENFRVGEEVEGALIVEVEPGSTADEQGLRVGDVIASVALRPVETAKDAAEQVEKAREDGTSVITVKASRQGTESFFALRLKQA